ncbi:putative activator of c kinase protein 1 [Golovinomyces cichoracearum]|uniref:Putative activator of c kinase protein 1 n=1 Tax=Golovinomyces cichoracearum TaxID=62708 RepID=A0A420ICL7_9PEZI|nr:putative activator of c kinase protein 1 [Golovinomyces cichoracearum]
MAYNIGPSQISQRSYDESTSQRYESYQDQQADQYQPMGNNQGDFNFSQDYTMTYQDNGGGGRGSGRSLPPPQNSHSSPRGFLSQRGRGGSQPIQRPATADGMRNKIDPNSSGRGRGFQKSAPFNVGGARTQPFERSETTDTSRMRKPLISPILSPDQPAWDSPFPTFPGTQKKSALTKEQEILEQMSKMELSETTQPQPRASGRKENQDMKSRPRGSSRNDSDQFSKISPRQGFPAEGDIRKNSDQRNLPRRYPKDLSENGYSDLRQGIPEKNMKMVTQNPSLVRKAQMTQPVNGFGNNSAGRVLPQRPSTAAGVRQPPQPQFQNRMIPMQIDPNTGSTNQNGFVRNRSLSNLYDDYYESDTNKKDLSPALEMPDFNIDSASYHRRGSSFEAHMQIPSYNNMSDEIAIKPLRLKQNMYEKPQALYDEQLQPLYSEQQQPLYSEQLQPQPLYGDQSQPLYSEQPQPLYNEQSSEWNSSGPSNITQSSNFGRYAPNQGYNEQFTHLKNSQPPQSPTNFQLPIRSSSTATGKTDVSGALYSDVGEYGQNYSKNKYMEASADKLPSHPLPARPGLQPDPVYPPSTATHPNNKPTPIRNYSGLGPTQSLSHNPSSDALPATAELTSELEQLRNYIKNNPSDQAVQLQLAKRLIDDVDSVVQPIIDQRTRNKTREKHVMEAHRILKKLVAQQNVEAMFFLADCYGRGAPGLEVDHKEAFSLYQSAAKVGHAAAAYRTAVCCELGNEEGGGTRKDPLKAIQWYKRAAMLGDTPAMYKMGIVLLKGLLGQQRNPREAIGWLKRAAERADVENPHALHELALLYEQPQGSENSVIRDEAYSFQLFQQAAELGYKFSQFRLGCAYEYGLFNCPIDPKLSILWYSRAAAQGEHQSELALSGWYLTGSEGVLQQSDTEAYLWARKAAIAGLAKAEYAMGYFTEVGIGSPGNLDDAKRWYWRAAAQNFPKARERLEVLKRGGSKAVLRPREKVQR